jgi:glycosyltransferase involved in cell wall biosynthesis
VKVRVDGKQFAANGDRFLFRGVTYGTFQPRADGARFPERDVVKRDFAAMADAGFTVVRTYTAPPDDLVDLAADSGLHLLAGVFYPDWRYLVGRSASDRRRVAREARREVSEAARRLRGADHVLALSLGNEIPADVLRWEGVDTIAAVIDELADVVRSEDPEQLVTYANYPTAEYLPLDCLDFLTFNVFLEQQADFRKYLTRLHHLAGDRPVVLGEVGLDATGGTPEGERRQAAIIDWQLETALERGIAGWCTFAWTDEWWVGDEAVEGWHFGLTREDRSPRPALDVVTKWNSRSVSDLRADWLPVSVVICAYNGAATIDECLQHTCELDYPNLEIIVVDDGSTDDTAAITRRHPRARLLTIEHAGLSVARNAGCEAASNPLVVYLDSDAYPTPEWLYYLVLGLEGSNVGGVGGPNLPPADDGVGAQMVARAPGGPVHVLVGDDRAEHVPGCNMAFWKSVLHEVGGFDPIYMAAGDDVDLCWKVLDKGWEIGFHPAALVWHHRRPGARAYLRQQRGYGRAVALVEARLPDRFTTLGTARWRGRIYNPLVPSIARPRVYHGVYGAAAYQSVYQGGGHTLDLAHQVGVPAALILLCTAPLALVDVLFAAVALVAVAGLAALGAVDVVHATPPRSLAKGRFRFRAGVAWMHLLQPLVRTWGRIRHTEPARRNIPPAAPLPGPPQRLPGGVLLVPEDRARAEVAAAMVTTLRRSGARVVPASGWETFDARIVGSSTVTGDLVTTSHPVGSIQARTRVRLRARRITVAAAMAALVAVVSIPVAAVFAAVVVSDICLGWWRGGRRVRRVLFDASARDQRRDSASSAPDHATSDVRPARVDVSSP